MGYELDNRLSIMNWGDFAALMLGEGEQLELPFPPISTEDSSCQISLTL